MTRQELSALAAFMTDDVRLRLGNAEPVQGRSAFVEAVTAFLASVAGFRHEVLNVWSTGDALIAEFDVHCTRLDGERSPFPAGTCSGSGTAWLRSAAATSTPRPSTPDPVVSGVEVIVQRREVRCETGGRATGAGDPWLVVVIVCVAQFMVVRDATIVNVALPSIQRGQRFSPSSPQWVINRSANDRTAARHP